MLLHIVKKNSFHPQEDATSMERDTCHLSARLIRQVGGLQVERCGHFHAKEMLFLTLRPEGGWLATGNSNRRCEFVEEWHTNWWLARPGRKRDANGRAGGRMVHDIGGIYVKN